MERLHKFLSRAGVASRRLAEDWIRAGRVAVNGQLVTEMGVKIDADLDQVQVDGRLVRPPAAPVTVMLHKPYGYISSTHDPQGRRVVTDLLRDAFKERLYPVGRLDYDATGLLLLTNDGDLAYRLTHPGYQVPRIYRVTVAGDVSPETLGLLTEGVTVGDRTVTALVEVKKRESGRTVLELVLREGRYHLVKRLLLHVGHPVLKLKRIAFGPLHLGTLPRGDFRMLSREEIEALKTKVQMR
ncbi:MAG: pseudouridine synthase [Desulfobacca sp. RBG_16_58_9]|nr:MAG: pseudouridine synthase [Desulfobacca sp. RBG_16_58_9]